MSTAGFDPAERLSCTACGTVYDPDVGDPRREVPPGTPFARLPEVWRCPRCYGPRHGFFEYPAGMDLMTGRVTALVEGYRHVARTETQGLDACNPLIEVEAVGFRPLDTRGWIGAVITPRALDLVLMPEDPGRWDGLRDGDTATVAMPSGLYGFTARSAGALGMLLTIPAASDMHLFPRQEDARAAAEAALHTLLTPKAEETAAPIPAPVPAPKQQLSRRALFRGRRA